MKKLLFLLLLPLSIFGQDTTKLLDKVTVVGVRVNNKLPITQTTLSDSALLKNYQGDEVPLLLKTQTSVFTYSDGGHNMGYSYFSIRGFGQQRINLTLNNVPLNEPEDQAAYTTNYPTLINAIHSIQIQRGVGSSTNGSAAFVGSINMFSKSGLSKENTLTLGLGSYRTNRLNYTYSSGLKNKYAYTLNIGSASTDGFRRASGMVGGSVYFSGGYFDDKRTTKIVLFSGVSQNEMSWEGSLKETLVNDYRNNPRGVDRPDIFSQTHLQLHNVNFLSQKVRLSNILFYNYLKGRYDVYNRAELPVRGYYAFERSHSNYVGYITQVDYKIGGSQFNFGLQASNYQRNHSGLEMYDSLIINNAGIKNELSGFLKYSLNSDIFKYYIDLQIRNVNFKYNDYTIEKNDPINGPEYLMPKKSWTFLNPKFGIKATPSDDLQLWYMIGISHREPTRSVIFSNNFYYRGKQAYNAKSEEVIDFEFGSKYKINNWLLSAVVYYYTFNNQMIAAGPLGGNSLPKVINVPVSNKIGLELEYRYEFNKHVFFDGNTTISKSRFSDTTKSGELILNPRFISNNSIIFDFPKYYFSISNQMVSKSFIDIDNTTTIRGFSIWNLNGTIKGNKANFSFQVNNLFNKKYYTNGYVTPEYGANRINTYLFPNALLNVYCSVSIKL